MSTSVEEVAGPGPLSGISVLDLSSVGPASRCTRLLADYGAEVTKVGPVPGRAAPGTTPPPWAYSAGRGTRRLQIDLRQPAGVDAFLAVAEGADVVVESFRPGVADRMGIGYSSVKERNRRVVYVSTSGYGQTGARENWAGHDLDYLAVGGYLAMSEPLAQGRPPLPGATIADSAAGGMHAALAVCVALVQRASSGEGAYLDVAVTDGVLWLMSLAVEEQLATGTGVAPGHDVLSGRFACYGTYTAGDGRHLAVAAIEPKFFANLCELLGCSGWADKQYDEGAQEELRQVLAAAFAGRGRDEWVAVLAGADTCVAPVHDIAEVAADPHFAERGAFVEAVGSDGRRFRQLSPLLAGMRAPRQPVTLPGAGTDTEALLRQAGMASSLVAELLEAGVVA
ncbi:MAG TPA: CaiB/BaiF CoA-transferase family protein [Acidimicrobiales bacterium]|nr:CaiB/BaiF CoA-transferase family protein [Acidimicrobiales bacterium]